MNTRLHTLLFTALALVAVPALAHAEEHRGEGRVQRGYVFDNRFEHGHYYPRVGLSVNIAPPGGRELHFRGSPYYYNAGVWYRPFGPRYVVVNPPIGIGVSVLPPYYTRVWFAGVPYYYADGTYYLWEPTRSEYVVTAPPANESAASTSPPANPQVYAYPRNGQSESQQATDRYECHDWATRQSGFDPTQPLGGVSQAQVGEKRADYQRAERACLEGRGYSVN